MVKITVSYIFYNTYFTIRVAQISDLICKIYELPYPATSRKIRCTLLYLAAPALPLQVIFSGDIRRRGKEDAGRKQLRTHPTGPNAAPLLRHLMMWKRSDYSIETLAFLSLIHTCLVTPCLYMPLQHHLNMPSLGQ